ncbi:MAG: NAD(P)-binding domain-containing protein, partial [Pacificimonas sp.]
MNKIGTLWVVGGGNMGGALLSRWAEAASAETIVVIDPADITVPDGAHHVRDVMTAGPAPDVVVLAVKPHHVEQVCPPLASFLADHTLIVSVMAGVALSNLTVANPTGTMIRAMPNTPAQVGKGATGLFAPDLNDDRRDAITNLFAAAGSVHWLTDEAQFDALTGVSGSGPAY